MGSGFHNFLSFLYLLPQAQAPQKSRIMFIIPVKAGIQTYQDKSLLFIWFPAYAGMTFFQPCWNPKKK